MGRMALGCLAGEVTRQVFLQEGFGEGEAALGSTVVGGGALGAHMPTGGLIARGGALTTEGAASAGATTESGGLLGRLRAAGQEFGQWRKRKV